MYVERRALKEISSGTRTGGGWKRIGNENIVHTIETHMSKTSNRKRDGHPRGPETRNSSSRESENWSWPACRLSERVRHTGYLDISAYCLLDRSSGHLLNISSGPLLDISAYCLLDIFCGHLLNTSLLDLFWIFWISSGHSWDSQRVCGTLGRDA